MVSISASSRLDGISINSPSSVLDVAAQHLLQAQQLCDHCRRRDQVAVVEHGDGLLLQCQVVLALLVGDAHLSGGVHLVGQV